ncbi:MAG: AsmA family protein [Geobacteraceae bacterium]|nr:AsmA family protein [Geobacteraceae bacterium]
MRLVRLLAIMLLVAIFGLCSAVIAVYFLATPDKIRAALIPVIEEQLECDVEFAGIDVNLFSGVRITGLDIAVDEGEQPWLQVDEAVLRYRFLPLLQGRLVIDNLRLNAPSIVVRREADGTIAIGDIVRKPQRSPDSLLPSDTLNEHKQVDFHISTITVVNAEVLVRDFVFGPIPRLTRLQEVGLQLENFSADSAWSFALWGKLGGTPLDVEGVFDPRMDRGSLKLVLEGLDLVAFQPYYREHLPFRINSLKVSTQCRLQFDSAGVDLKGDIRLEDADFSGIAAFAPEDDAFSAQQLSANLHLNWMHNSTQVKLLRADARMDGLEFGAHGTASFAAEQHEYSMNVELRQWPVRALVSHAALSWLDHFEAYAPAGTCSARFAWRKDAKDSHGSVRTGRVTLVDAGFSAGGLRLGLSGDIKLEGDKLKATTLNAKIGGENIHASIFSKNWRAARPLFELSLKGAKLDAWNLLAPARAGSSSGSGAPSAQGNITRVASEPGPYAIPFNVEAAFELDTISWRTTMLQRAKGNLSITNNELILENMDGVFASGKVSANASVDLGQQGFSYSANLQGRQLNMKQVLAAMRPGFSGTISGKGQINARITGAGTQQLRVRQNMSGSIRLAVENGSVRGVNTLHVLAQQLNIPSLTRLDFIAASAEFQLKAANTPYFTLLGRNEQLRVSARGSVGWQGQTEGHLTMHLIPSLGVGLSPEFVRSAKIDDNGWNVVNSDFAGSASQPEFSPAAGEMDAFAESIGSDG